ncbi:YeeE/YedE family protein [Vibrio clamense]|uniref:YeeE/YedE family protein n=1 Tax=Vibrio clamense TaxID=2910254 RepID=UPI003D2066BD
MSNVIPWDALFGGVLLGISASLLLLLSGKIAGISGVLSGLMKIRKGDFIWRLLFVIGMISGGFFCVNLFGGSVPAQFDSSFLVLAVAGLLVGVGTRLGNGCTSGHGICGLGRVSRRSIVATSIFMSVAAFTVFVRLHLI